MNNRHVINSDIKVGEAVIFYDNCEDNPGWVLPGGEKTTNKAIAVRVANNINKRIRIG